MLQEAVAYSNLTKGYVYNWKNCHAYTEKFMKHADTCLSVWNCVDDWQLKCSHTNESQKMLTSQTCSHTRQKATILSFHPAVILNY